MKESEVEHYLGYRFAMAFLGCTSCSAFLLELFGQFFVHAFLEGFLFANLLVASRGFGGLLAEFIHTTFRIDQNLLTCEERVALAADFYADSFLGGSNGEFVIAVSAHYFSVGEVFWMGIGLHE